MSDASGERTKTENGTQAATDRIVGGAVRRWGLYVLLPFLGSLPAWGPTVLGRTGAAAESQAAASTEAREARAVAAKTAEAQAATDRAVAQHGAAIEYIRVSVEGIGRRLDTMDARLDKALGRGGRGGRD